MLNLLWAAGLLVQAPPAAWAVPRVKAVASLDEVVQGWLDRRPRVIAFGEWHQRETTKATPSALHRFTDEIWPRLGPTTADLVVETWVTSGACGAAETTVTADVARTTERPAQTEDEIVTLLRRAKTSGARPHILDVTCDEYAALASSADGVDYEKVLTLTGDKLLAQTRAALALPPPEPDRRTVVVYGGALHNDLHPAAGTEAFAFGRRLFADTEGAVIEVDLAVPEFVERSGTAKAEPWYAAYRKRARPGCFVVVERSARSFVIVWPRGAVSGAAKSSGTRATAREKAAKRPAPR